MPRFKYELGSGIVLKPGKGFEVSGCPIKESLETISLAATETATAKNYGWTSIVTTGGGTAAGAITLGSGDYAGQEKGFVFTTDDGDAVVEVTTLVEASNTFTAADAMDLLLFVWTGTAWSTVKNTGWTAS
jgi:hypothetical protein